MSITETCVALCGGGLHDILEDPRHREVIAPFVSNKRVLVYPFAQKVDGWRLLLERLSACSITPLKRVAWIAAESSRAARLDQLVTAESVFIFGGDERRFFEFVDREELETLLKVPFVVGSSAGVNIFSRAFYSNDHSEIRYGAGLLPIKTICHYSAKNHAAYQLLSEHPIEGRTIALADRDLFILRHVVSETAL